ncbi:PIN domain-containing protein [Streptomyces pseudogriseolus]|uniref:PIN domain-containing protein n=1 Tax=Streptomyces pseudogriseolus TaxID=36817 RepID=UPI003FA2FCB2
MIILDSSILRGIGLEDSSADLLRAIRTLTEERVAAPWAVLEEISAQRAVKYQEKYAKAAEAIEQLAGVTPWPLDFEVGEDQLDDVRRYWRAQWLQVVEEIPTSDWTLRQGAFREMNLLPPCKQVSGKKVGARDAAIWLSAIEFAREHPEETVYFVSEDKDFKPEAYPQLMRADLDGLGERRFVHLTRLQELVDRFTESTTPDKDLVCRVLQSPAAAGAVARASREIRPTYGSILCTAATLDIDETPSTVSARVWLAASTSARFDGLDSVKTYRVGDHEWGIAVARWSLTGTALLDFRELDPMAAACEWTTSVLFRMDPDDPGLSVLRHQEPTPVSAEKFKALKPTVSFWPTGAEKTVAGLVVMAEELRSKMPSQALASELGRRMADHMGFGNITFGDTSAG